MCSSVPLSPPAAFLHRCNEGFNETVTEGIYAQCLPYAARYLYVIRPSFRVKMKVVTTLH